MNKNKVFVHGIVIAGAVVVASQLVAPSAASAGACYYSNSYYHDITGSRGCIKPYGDDVSVKDTKADYHSALVGWRQAGSNKVDTLWITTGYGDWGHNPNFDMVETTYYLQACTGESSTWKPVTCSNEYAFNAGAQLSSDVYLGGTSV